MSPTMTAAERGSVHFAHLARQLGLTERQRQELLRERLVTPVNGRSRQGSPTWITAESARTLREARRILQWMKDNKRDIVGITIIVIVRLLLSGAMTPSLPPGDAVDQELSNLCYPPETEES
jgi:hypothetical protein